MNNRRPPRTEEITLIHYLLDVLQLEISNYTISELVEEYEGGKMGSISLGGNPDAYAGDLIRVEYIDSDETPVVITLTHDDQNQLLDLDFWKIDFSKLLTYPSPDKIIFKA
jgi:hypothetical protein